MQSFVPLLAGELERPRVLAPQVADHISSHYDVSRDQLGRFLSETLPGLEDYEVDLVLSPIFTPTLADQARLSDELDRRTLPASAWPDLVRALAARPTVAQLVTEDGVSHGAPLREVTIERFVNRLNLDQALPERFSRLLNSLPPAADRPTLKAVARRPIWREEARATVLFQYLLTTASGDGYQLAEVIQLLQWAETYQPRDIADLLDRIPAWEEVLRREINVASNPRPFFNDRVKEMHGGGRDQRGTNETLIASKRQALAFLSKIRAALGPAERGLMSKSARPHDGSSVTMGPTPDPADA